MSDLQKIKEQVSIRDVAESLLHLEKQDGKYKYPGERTASIQLYTDAQSFNDFGRNVGGDIFDLMIHVRGYTLKEAIAELKSAFNIKDSPIGENTVKEAWIAYLERKFNVMQVTILLPLARYGKRPLMRLCRVIAQKLSIFKKCPADS